MTIVSFEQAESRFYLELGIFVANLIWGAISARSDGQNVIPYVCGPAEPTTSTRLYYDAYWYTSWPALSAHRGCCSHLRRASVAQRSQTPMRPSLLSARHAAPF